METLIVVVVSVLVIVGIGIFAWAYRRGREKKLAAQWEHLMEQALNPGLRVAYIDRVYQRAASGTKADVIWWDTKGKQDAWFPEWQASSGVFVLLQGNTGYGPHNKNDVFFAKRDGIQDATPGEAHAAWKRRQKRQGS